MIDFQKLRKICKGTVSQENNGITPIVAQDYNTKEVLILAYINKEALKYYLTHKVAAFWSTSRNKLWVKSLTFGSVLRLVEVRINCEQNFLLFLVSPKNDCGACHDKRRG